MSTLQDPLHRDATRGGETSPKAFQIDLRELVTPLFRYRRAALRVALGVFVLALALILLVGRRLYTSEMQVLVEADRTDPAITAGSSAPVMNHTVSTDQVASELELLKGPDMMLAVVDRCGLDTGAPSWRDLFHSKDPAVRHAIRREALARTLDKKITAKAGITSDVIVVKYSVIGEPETARCVLAALGDLYMSKHLLLERPSGSSELFALEAAQYKTELERSEAALAALSQHEGVAAPDVLKVDLAGQLATLQGLLAQARQAYAADAAKEADLRQQLASTTPRSATTHTALAASQLEQNLAATLLAAQNHRSELALKYSSTYPLVQQADAEIAQTEHAIEQAHATQYVDETTDRDPTYVQLQEQLAGNRSDMAAQLASARVIERSIAATSQRMVHLDALSIQQAALQREVHLNEANYLLYVGKREQERTSDALDRRGIANVAIAVKPSAPVNPALSTTLMLALALVASLLSGVATALLLEAVDATVRTPDEARTLLHLPVLATTAALP